MRDELKRFISQGAVENQRLSSIRVKLHVPCQWACNFCHMEGNPSSQSVRNDIQFSEALTSFRDRFGFTEVHFTGGEPSIHPEIINFIKKARDLGFEVKMTTNGQTKPSRYVECIQAGLSELNMSIHTLDSGSLGKLMSPPKSVEWGRIAIQRQIDLIDALHERIKIKVNTCVGETEFPALALANFIRQRNISWRLMVVLEISDRSFASLERIFNVLGAVPISASISSGSSSCSVNMECDDGFSFKLKMIRPYFLDEMCSGCEMALYGGCYEFAYGPRLEMDRGMLMVRNCIHRDGPPFSLPVQAYFQHPIAQQLHEEIFR
jgi:cyclic pyranopterin phosphate synthase